MSIGKGSWGFDGGGVDITTSPQDDFFQYANGIWLATTVIPSDEALWGLFSTLARENRERLRIILDELAHASEVPQGGGVQKLGDLYATGMDREKRNEEGIQPLIYDLARISVMRSVADLTPVLARLHLIGGAQLWNSYVDQDPKESAMVSLWLYQGGLGLPDRDYYVIDEKQEIREEYSAHIQRMLGLLGIDEDTAESEASDVIEIEMELAKVSWECARLRDVASQCNYFTVAGLVDLCPLIDWKEYFRILGIDSSRPIIVGQPGFIAKIQALLSHIPFDGLKAYLRWHFISASSRFLSEEFVQENFSFYGKTLTGQQESRPLWERCISFIDAFMGDEIGKLFIEHHFQPEARTKIHELVVHITAVCAERIRNVEWMDDVTKTKALEKLNAITWKLGFPDEWRDYSGLEIIGTDAYAVNVFRAHEYEMRRQFAKVGQPVDRTEWKISPQTVNAYANPGLVEMVFPAGILQWPFFDPEADDAINYGGIGMVIAHELLHHFDDQGSQFDSQGNLNNWWQDEDRKVFEKRAASLVEQFNQYELFGKKVNGKLTLGENIADLAGLQIAYAAYQRSQQGKRWRVLDGFTPEQRFFLGFAQIWRMKMRDELAKNLLIIDPHAPAEFRVNGPLSNTPEFYEAFDVKEGRGMYRPPSARARVW